MGMVGFTNDGRREVRCKKSERRIENVIGSILFHRSVASIDLPDRQVSSKNSTSNYYYFLKLIITTTTTSSTNFIIIYILLQLLY